MILKTLKIQPTIYKSRPSLDLYKIVLSFGSKKTDGYNFPIVFKNIKAAENLYDELKLGNYIFIPPKLNYKTITY